LKRRFDPDSLSLALPPATDYKHVNNILSLQMVGRWPTFLWSEDTGLLPEDMGASGDAGLGSKGGNG